MESVGVLDTNPILFVQRVVEQIKNGYYAEPSNEGYISTYPMFEIRLYQKEAPKAKKFDSDEIFISEYDNMKFILAIQDAVVAGYGIEDGTLDWNTVGSSYVKMYKLPIIPDEVYTREELEAMPWDQLKGLGYRYDCFNRRRKVMESALMKIFEGV